VHWHCWVEWQEGHAACKNWVLGCWCSYLSGARLRFAYMAQLMPLLLTISCTSKSRLVLPFCYWLTRVLQQQQQLLLQPFYGPLSGTQKKHSLTDAYPDCQSSLISCLHLLWSIASSLFNLHVWQSFCTIPVQVLFGLLLGLAPLTTYFVRFCNPSFSPLCNTCPYQCNLFCCSTEIMLSSPSLSQLYLELCLSPFISACWSATLLARRCLTIIA